jgi:hypothetical protein
VFSLDYSDFTQDAKPFSRLVNSRIFLQERVPARDITFFLAAIC